MKEDDAYLFYKQPFEFHIDESTGCFICTYPTSKNKFGHVKVKRNGKYSLVHRLIYEECFGRIPDGMVVRHTCDNPTCINPEHLLIGTHGDNVRDRVNRGRSARGVTNGRSKLTEEQVRKIRSENLLNNIELETR